MISTKRRKGVANTIRLLATIAAALSPWLCGGRQAEAQYYGGYGGFGFGYNQNAYSDVNFLNSWSLQNASAAAANRPKALTAPRFESRDDSIYEKYDLQTRMSMIDRVARDPAGEMGTADPSGVLPSAPRPRPKTTTPSGPTPPPYPNTVNLANYFNKDHQLIWPSVSPISGDYGKKQTVADLAALAVLNEYNMKGLAQLSTVTDARQKLLDYGRPALQYVRESSTPALADSFHVFLLALYGNLGNAATVPKAQ
jgi:hypothetical protein